MTTRKELVAVGVLAALLIVGAVAVALNSNSAEATHANAPAQAIALNATADANHSIQWDDKVFFRYTMFNASGKPIFTNQYASALIINNTDPLYLISEIEDYKVSNLTLGAYNVGQPFGTPFEASFIGHHAGETYVTPLIAANDTVTGSTGVHVTLTRVSKDFPMRESVPSAAFRQRFPNATEGSVVQLNPRYFVTVEAMNDTVTTYRYLVHDGEQHPYPELGEFANLTTIVSADRTTFHDRIDIPTGAAFFRKNDHVLNLTHGSYYVRGVTPDSILLDQLKAPWYAHLFEDVFFVVEVVEVQPAAR